MLTNQLCSIAVSLFPLTRPTVLPLPGQEFSLCCCMEAAPFINFQLKPSRSITEFALTLSFKRTKTARRGSGKLDTEEEGHFTYQSFSAHLFFFPCYYSSDSFPFLILSTEKLLSSVLPAPPPFSLDHPPRPPSQRLVRHKRGFQPADSDGWLGRGTQWWRGHVSALQLTFQRTSQSRSLT